ncbi:MAG: hypothetical protein LBS83_02560 [Holosporales bacterium]|jgi:hypothetical protein|nr:hypothetical protein [Holosporales bacterium]
MLEKFLKFILSAGLALLVAGCSQKIDFENDVPQRAKSISNEQVKKARESMSSPELRRQYRDYEKNSSSETLADLQRRKRELERRIATILRANSNNSNICSICKKKYNMHPSKKRAILRKKRKVQRPVVNEPSYQQVIPVAPAPNVPFGGQSMQQSGYIDPNVIQTPMFQQPIPMLPQPQYQQSVPMQPYPIS